MDHIQRPSKRARKRVFQEKARTWLHLSETQVAMGWFVVLGLAAVLGAIYLSQASSIATTGRHLQVAQADLETLKRQNALIEQDIAKAQSLERLQAEAIGLGYRPAGADDLEYLVVADYPDAPIATPTPIPAPPEPASTITQAFWLTIRHSVNNLVQGESRE